MLGAGEIADGLGVFELALAKAEPLGFVRIFLDEGIPIARLLYEAVARDIVPEYARLLLSAIPTENRVVQDSAPPKPGIAAETDLFEPLSEREIEVLRLIGEGLSNQEVGAKLFISIHTVKAHTRNLYAKLNAHSRTEAVAKGRAFGLLGSV